MSIRNTLSVLGAALVMAGALAPASADANPAVDLLTRYFDLLASGNIESARYLWLETDQERANRFDIEYAGNPMRVDATSPIIRDLDVMRNYLNPPVKRYEDLADGFVRLEYSAMVNGRPVEQTYYARLVGDYYWLCHAQDYYARDWPDKSSRYFHIHYEPSLEPYLGSGVLEACDAVVDRIMDSLQFDRAARDTLAQKKIEYFYCPTDSVVKEITGNLTKGMLDQATNDVISANFPHFHELTHLLTNIKLKKVSLYTLPLVREGLAVRYGGRWGKEPSALLDIGVYLYKEQLVMLDSMLTYDDFLNGSSADISYPVAGLFITFLMDRMGNAKFYELFNASSGTYETVSGMDNNAVKNLILSYSGHKDWADLEADFSKFLDNRLESNSVVLPGGLNKGKPLISGDAFKVTRDKKWVSFVFTGNADQPVKGNLLFGHDSGLDGQRSLLFDEQYQGQEPFEGYRYGVRYDENEAGLYDYATNQLVAKYIWGISPSPAYYDADTRTVTIRFRQDLVGAGLPDKVQGKWLPY